MPRYVWRFVTPHARARPARRARVSLVPRAHRTMTPHTPPFHSRVRPIPRPHPSNARVEHSARRRLLTLSGAGEGDAAVAAHADAVRGDPLGCAEHHARAAEPAHRQVERPLRPRPFARPSRDDRRCLCEATAAARSPGGRDGGRRRAGERRRCGAAFGAEVARGAVAGCCGWAAEALRCRRGEADLALAPCARRWPFVRCCRCGRWSAGQPSCCARAAEGRCHRALRCCEARGASALGAGSRRRCCEARRGSTRCPEVAVRADCAREEGGARCDARAVARGPGRRRALCAPRVYGPRRVEHAAEGCERRAGRCGGGAEGAGAARSARRRQGRREREFFFYLPLHLRAHLAHSLTRSP